MHAAEPQEYISLTYHISTVKCWAMAWRSHKFNVQFSGQTGFLFRKVYLTTAVLIADCRWWRDVFSPIHRSGMTQTQTCHVWGSVCGSKVTSFTAMPFFFCFVCKHSEGSCHTQAPDCWGGLSLLYKRLQRDRTEASPVVFGLWGHCYLLMCNS